MHISKIETCSWPLSSTFELDADLESRCFFLLGLFVNGHDDVFRFILTVARPFCVKPKRQPFIALFDGLVDFLQQSANRFTHNQQRHQNWGAEKMIKLMKWKFKSKHVEQRNVDKTETTTFFHAATWIYLLGSELQRQKSYILYAKANICIHMCVSIGKPTICIWALRCTSNYRRQIKTFNINLLFRTFFRHVDVCVCGVLFRWNEFYFFAFCSPSSLVSFIHRCNASISYRCIKLHTIARTYACVCTVWFVTRERESDCKNKNCCKLHILAQ